MSFNPYSTGFSSFILKCILFQKGTLTSFNPYSIGFYSLINQYININLVKCTVSILILLDSLLLYVNLKKNTIQIELFQSLFYWILFFYLLWVTQKYSLLIYSFNPYSTGFSSFINSRQFKLVFKIYVSILILLDSLLL